MNDTDTETKVTRALVTDTETKDTKARVTDTLSFCDGPYITPKPKCSFSFFCSTAGPSTTRSPPNFYFQLYTFGPWDLKPKWLLLILSLRCILLKQTKLVYTWIIYTRLLWFPHNSTRSMQFPFDFVPCT